jgi:hypothetical protein
MEHEAVALAFTDDMQGWLDGDRRISLSVTVSTDDVDRFLSDPDDAARVAGWVRCEALGGLLAVEHGQCRAVARGLEYRLAFRDLAGMPLTLEGRRDGHELRARVHAGHDPEAAVVATALLEADAAKLRTSMRVSPPLRLDALARFSALLEA